MIQYKYTANSKIYKAGRLVEEINLSALPAYVIDNAIRQGTIERIKDPIIDEVAENVDILEAVENEKKEVSKTISKKLKTDGS